MRLSKIKLAGFKSFVDPTTIHFPTNLTGVVGPNGCGKSNVIDAVRWVMGESSAKNLRGDSLADVIFNGSRGRKPVGVASIELIFDNADGAIGGAYAQFGEVSIKRNLARDGISTYFINGSRCRRRDITNIFLGTGLGPRSYAIVEQGMVSRLIEAKPEDMRVYLEEAAGISKYKDKRRETENRIRHTRENLERLTDVRDEVDKQLKHLQRQSRMAEKYKEHKTSERRLEAELLALRMRELEHQLEGSEKVLTQKQMQVDAAIAEQREIEAQIEKARAGQSEKQSALTAVQEQFYRHGAEVARLEQSIQHARELRDRQSKELARLLATQTEVANDIQRDREQLDEISTNLNELTPALDAAREAQALSSQTLQAAQGGLDDWRERWEQWTEQFNAAQQKISVEQARLIELHKQSENIERQYAKVVETRSALSPDELQAELGLASAAQETAGTRMQASQRHLNASTERLAALREQDSQLTQKLDAAKSELQTLTGRTASLEALQQAALGESKDGVVSWLRGSGLGEQPRLAQALVVQRGWEQAVETVLGSYLEAVCVDGIDAYLDSLGRLSDGSVTLYEHRPATVHTDNVGLASLASKLSGKLVPESLLSGVFAADTLTEALGVRDRLAPGQSIVTGDGVWLSGDWLRVSRGEDEHAGVIAREGELRDLRASAEQAQQLTADLQRQQSDVREASASLESEREALQGEANAAHGEHARSRSRCEALAARMETLSQQIGALDSDRSELEVQQRTLGEAIARAEEMVETGEMELEGFRSRGSSLREARERLEEELDQAREAAEKDRENAQAIAIQAESRKSARESLQSALARLEDQVSQYAGRTQELRTQVETAARPIQEQEQALETQLRERVDIEAQLTARRDELQAAEAGWRQLDEQRAGRERAVNGAREQLDGVRLKMQETKTRYTTFAEQFEGHDANYAQVCEGLPEQADTGAWEAELEKVAKRIARLGPINLAAIDEFQAQAERKEYLDSQNSDLSEALETLEGAMRKIDRETRTRFKETFDKVDAGLKRIYPKLFGGGHAYLELSENDLLNAGVTVMARPPGKRNSSIHLLSGGEKAMTAVALIFSIFELNPAPFCMLDEVDAPLDDANVDRFCAIVKEMSERVQFVVITHNKTTIEMATHLSGVTMQEPGVSRLVAVDVDEAVQLAAM